MDIPLCLEGIIGVTNLDCDCLLNGRPAGYNAALSNLYLDQKIDLKIPGGSIPCGAGTVWDVCKRAIDAATREYMTAQFRCWSEDHDPITPKRFYVGERTFNGPLAPRGAFAGLLIRPHPHIKHGEFIIHSVDTAFTTAGSNTIGLMCWDSVTDTVLWTANLDTSANKLHQNVLSPAQTEPFTIPYTDFPRYYLIYEVGSMVPMDSDCFCDCNTKKAQMSEWCEIEGVYGDDIDNRNSWSTNSLNHGLFIDITFRCNATKDICVDALDFSNDPTAMQKAEAIYYRALQLVAEDALKRTDHSGFVDWDRETLVTMRNLWAQEHKVRMDFLCANAPDRTSCYRCKEASFRMQSLSD